MVGCKEETAQLSDPTNTLLNILIPQNSHHNRFYLGLVSQSRSEVIMTHQLT